MAYVPETQDGKPAKRMLAELTGDNPELIAGYLIVSVRIDGTMIIGHNACCTAHIVNQLLCYMRDHPEVNALNPALPNAHDR